MASEENNTLGRGFHYHEPWVANRIKFMLKHYPAEFWKGKRVLELGAMFGDIGAYFTDLGAIVCGIEGRQMNIDQLKTLYPKYGENVILADLDTPDWPWGEFDVIINFGLFYHLEKFHEEHLRNCLTHAPLMFFETVIADSDEDDLYFVNENGQDQSLTDRAGTPSTSYIENRLTKRGAHFTRYDSKELNGWLHHYDWEATGTHHARNDGWARRFWIISNDK